MALHGGEDYGLLFTVPQLRAAQIPKQFRGTALTRIGEMARGRGLTLIGAGGERTVLEPRGWDHFRTQGR
jgi:thiamine-monophosphate kinase